MNTQLPASSTIEADKQFLAKYPSREEMELAYCPRFWSYALSHSTRAYLAVCPTLSSLDRIYGNGATVHWIRVQLVAIFQLSSSKDTGVVDEIKAFASLLAATMSTYKLTELMVFFAGYAAGIFGTTDYQTFDLRRISAAFLGEFRKERTQQLAAIKRERQQLINEQKDARDRANAISYEDYLRGKTSSLSK